MKPEHPRATAGRAGPLGGPGGSTVSDTGVHKLTLFYLDHTLMADENNAFGEPPWGVEK